MGKTLKHMSFSVRAKNALLSVLDKVAFVASDVSAEIEELTQALFNLDELVGISAVYTQGSKVIWSDGISTLNDLRDNLVVNAEYGDEAEVPINNYTLSGTLAAGTSAITVGYEGFTTTFNVLVTKYGTKSSYSFSDGSIVNTSGSIHEYTVGNVAYTGITNYGTSTTRRVFNTNFGIEKLRDQDYNYVNAYPIKIPAEATSVSLSVSGNAQEIAARVVYYDGTAYRRGVEGDQTYPYIRVTYTLNNATLNFSSVSGRNDTYLLVWGERSNNASYQNNEPTGVTITFLSE